jgi:PAS domain S-box-containing protein
MGPPCNATETVLAGGGEMGALMRATDWAATPVGPVETWPQSLRTAVSMLLDSKFGSMVAWGPDFTHFYNDAYRPILGASKHPAQGRRVADVFPEIWESFIKPLFEGVMQGKAVGFENLLVPLHRNGFLEEVYFTFSYSGIRDESGDIGGVLVTVSETTAQVIEERRLRLLNALAEVGAAQTPAEACALAAAEMARSVSDVPFALFYLLDESGQAALAGSFGAQLDREWPFSRVADEALFVALPDASAGARGAVILPIESSGGRRFGYAVLGLAPMLPASASYARFHKLVVASVSRSVGNAAARDEAATARSRMHAQLMQAPVAVSVVSGPQFVVSLANARYQELVGRDALLMRGRPFRELFPELPYDAPVFQMLEGVLRSGEAYTADEYKVMISRRGRLEDVYFLFTCQPIRDEQGKVTEIMTVAVDVTAQVLSRQRVETLMQQMQETDKRKDEFLATLAHELRNPMAAISMALTLMERTNDPAKNPHHREIAQRQMGNLVRLVDDLLDVSRITRGAVELRKEQVDLRNVVANAISAARVSLDSRNHQVAVSTSPGNYLLLADPTRLEQVITNLLTNAAKYTETGGLVSVSLTAAGGEAVLRVRDTGRGIPKEMLGKVFEMFVQVQQTIDRSKGGLGLGLTLVKRLVEMHGGTVSAHSEGEGQGSEFVVRLPMQPLSDAAFRPAAAAARAAGESRRILLVEDSEDIRETLAELFQELGHQVATAANGLDGVSQALALRPDVAFVDIGLPGIDGYEVARRIRAAPGGKELYLIALTGYGGAEATQAALDAGFDLHLTKPVDPANLPRLLHRR